MADRSPAVSEPKRFLQIAHSFFCLFPRFLRFHHTGFFLFQALARRVKTEKTLLWRNLK